MKGEEATEEPGDASRRRKYLLGGIIGAAVIVILGATVMRQAQNPGGAQNRASAQPSSLSTVLTASTTDRPQYHKKELVFKRTLAGSDTSSVRTSALSDGYKALSAIPAFVIAQPPSVRLPQFPTNADLTNYQALSTMGTPQYFANQNVQWFLNDLSAQQTFYEMNYQYSMNNLNNQQYLNNFNTYLYELKTQYSFNNLSNQQYLNSFNTYVSQLNSQYYMNNLNNQMYVNNYSNLNTFSNPTFYQPPQIYIPPPVYIPPPTFNTYP